MEVNTAVTLQFEDLAVKNLKLFHEVLVINKMFFFLNIVPTKCNSVQETVTNTVVGTLLPLVVNI